MIENDKIYRHLCWASRRVHTPDLHSFVVNLKNGTAFVECRGYDTVMEAITYDADNTETRKSYKGSNEEIANILNSLGAEPNTISY